MQSLQTLIDLLSRGRGIHISVLDIAGVLGGINKELRIENVIHSKEFCNIAKSTDGGLDACLRCKAKANRRAIEGKEPFSGHCVYGLYEAAYPVVLGGTVLVVVYVGNAILRESETRKRIERTSATTLVLAEALYEGIEECERIGSPDDLLAVAEVVADYIRLLLSKREEGKKTCSRTVELMRDYADKMYTGNPSLRELGLTLHKDERYIGRLFKKEMGVSFNSYLTEKRLEAVREQLLLGDDKIIDVVLECGFDSVSYLNRLFKARYGCSPREYRRASSELNRIKLNK